MEPTPTRPCRICRRTTRGDICARCFNDLYPEAAGRAADTKHARTMDTAAEAYEQARQADEAEAPTKDDYDTLMRRG